MKPNYFTSSDSGAPVMNRGTAGSAIAVLDFALLQSGWTKEFTGTNQVAYRNSPTNGLGCFVKVVDTATSEQGAFTIQTYRTMSDLTTGDDPTDTVYGFRSPANTTGDATWAVAATDRAFYFSGSDRLNPTDGRMLCFAGDVSKDDVWSYYAGGARSSASTGYLSFNSGLSASGLGGSTNNPGCFFGKNHDGIGGSIPMQIIMPMMGSTGLMGGYTMPKRPSTNNADEAVMPAYVGNRIDANDRVIRGRLPGAYIPLADIYDAEIGDSGPPIGAGSELRLFRFGRGNTTGYGGIWVDVGRSW